MVSSVKMLKTLRNEGNGGKTQSLLQGEELELGIKDALEAHVPWAKICHKFHVGAKTVNKIRDKYLRSIASTPLEEQIVREQRTRSNDPMIEGQMMAKAFRLLDKGISPHKLVEKLAVTPDLAEETNNWYVKLRHQAGVQHCVDCFNDGWMAAIQDMLEDYKSRGLYPNAVLCCEKCGNPINLDLENSITYVWNILSETSNSG